MTQRKHPYRLCQRLPNELRDALHQTAAQQGLTVGEVVRQAIAAHTEVSLTEPPKDKTQAA